MSKQLIVAGFHRSGTSLVCKLLKHAGLFLGYDLLGADVSNPHGHFEDLEIMELHKQILEDNGRTWQIAEPFSPDITGQTRQWMEQIVQRRDADHDLWGFKDPRVCLVLPAWKSLLPDARVLLVYRHPADAAHSLDKRHSTALFTYKGDPETHLRFWEEPDLALKMWLVHNEALLAFARAHPEDALAVSLDMVHDGFPVVEAMEQRWSLGLDEVAASELFDASVTGRRPDKQPVSDGALVDRIDATWRALEQLGDQTEQIMGRATQRRRLSKDDFYAPAGQDAPRMENELLALGMRYLEARLAGPEYAKKDIEEQYFEIKRGLETGHGQKGEIKDPPRESQSAALEATVAEVEGLRRRIADSHRQQIADRDQKLSDGDKRLADNKQQITDRDKRLADKDKRLADSKQQITDRDKRLASRDKQITDRDRQLAAGDRKLADRDRLLADRDRLLAEKDRQRADSDRKLSDRVSQLADRDKQLADNKQQLAGRDKRLANSEQQLADKDMQLANSEQQLADKDMQLVDGEQQLADTEQQLADSEQQLADRDKQLASKDERLVASERQIANRDKRLADLQGQLSAVRAQRDRRAKEVERLVRWAEKLNLASSALLDSSRWKVGNAFGEVWRRISLQPRAPMAQDQLRDIVEEFRTRSGELEQGEVVQAESQAEAVESTEPPKPPPSTTPEPIDAAKSTKPPEPPPPTEQDEKFAQANGQADKEPPESPQPPPVATSEPRRLAGGAEHVLESLRSSRPVTVVVPIYNAYEDLKKFLPSVVRNTTSPVRLLLIDDASPDDRIAPLLAEYEAMEGVRVLTNHENLGFSGTINRGFAESGDDDVVIINSDVEVTPRWLENLKLAAHADPRTATVTPVSNKAGAFSVPEIGKENEVPEGLERDSVGRLVTQHSGQVYPHAPTGNGFCMYIKRAALDEVGLLDSKSFPRGYAEENDFCMRAQKLGWNHVVDDTTFIFHKRSASFGEEKKELLEAARKTLDQLHPEYTRLARTFVASKDVERVGNNVREAYKSVENGQQRVKPRILFVMHGASGGTPQTNLDLMSALSDRYSPYLLISNVLQLRLFRYEPEGGLVPVYSRDLKRKWEPTEFSRSDYRAIVFDLLVEYRFELIHIRHLLGHTFDLPEVADLLRIPVILSFHDFYFSCPTIHLIDDNGKYCGGVCTPGSGRQCTILTNRLADLPILKHAWLETWRRQVSAMFDHVDAFVTTSRAAQEVYLRSFPGLHDRAFEVIEHGRDLEQAHLAAPPEEGPIRILIPGNIHIHKGASFIRELQQEDKENRLEFHFLGDVAHKYRDLGINHGTYKREEFNSRVEEIKPSFMGIFPIWPETYCHTLTEAWGAGVPVLASNMGTIKERVKAHGGGWLLDHEDPKGSYKRILEIAGDRAAYARELQRADLSGIRSTREMSDLYDNLYDTVLRERRRFRPAGKVSTLS